MDFSPHSHPTCASLPGCVQSPSRNDALAACPVSGEGGRKGGASCSRDSGPTTPREDVGLPPASGEPAALVQRGERRKTAFQLSTASLVDFRLTVGRDTCFGTPVAGCVPPWSHFLPFTLVQTGRCFAQLARCVYPVSRLHQHKKPTLFIANLGILVCKLGTDVGVVLLIASYAPR